MTTTTDTTQPRALSAGETDLAVEVMLRAFFDDPLWRYLLPDESRRARYMPRALRPFIRFAIQNQRMYGVGNPAQGVSIWTFPGQTPVRYAALFRPDILAVLLNPAVLTFFRAFPIFDKFDEFQKRHAPGPHYYLNTIGVRPEAQGKGLASALIRPFLAQADARGMATYTETMTPSNVSLYEYYGFETVEAYPVPGTDLCIWAFYRPPL